MVPAADVEVPATVICVADRAVTVKAVLSSKVTRADDVNPLPVTVNVKVVEVLTSL